MSNQKTINEQNQKQFKSGLYPASMSREGYSGFLYDSLESAQRKYARFVNDRQQSPLKAGGI